MQTLLCPTCQRKLRARAELAGKTIRCPACQALVPIPPLASESATLPPPHESATMPPLDSAATLAPPVTGSFAPSVIPGYEILDELGRGGMGVVYKARQVSLNRIVALKMILAGGHAGEEGLTRFRAEAEAVARLQHPGIVQVFEVGESGGLPFFSLEYVEGGSLEQRLGGVALPAREAAALVESLALAMQHAHEQGVVHRDLKPANVLLASASGGREPPESGASGGRQSPESESFDARRTQGAHAPRSPQTQGAHAPRSPQTQGAHAPRSPGLVPKITDFGLAKKLESQGQTRTGSIMGTPSYMAPEQASGAKDIGPAADTYALGAILYECLTGRPPFRASTPLDTILQVIADEPIPPSRLEPKVPRDLETICLKCLQKETRKRYPSAAALADDLRAFLDDRPIAARPVGRLAQGWRWCRRNKAVASLLALVFVALSAGVAVSTAFGLNARGNAIEAEKNARLATASARRAEESEQHGADMLYARNLTQAHQEWLSANIFRARSFLELSSPERRGWEWDYLHRLFRAELFSMRGHQGFVVGMAVSPAGDRVATTGLDATTRLWDARTGEELANLAPPAYLLAFSPDGKRLAGASRQAIAVWDADNGRLLPLLRLEQKLAAIDWVEKGTLLAALTQDGDILFLDPDTGEEVRRCPKRVKLDRGTRGDLNRGHRPVFSPDGKYLAQGGGDSMVRVWDTATGDSVMQGTGHLMHVCQLAFSPDGKRLASPGGDGIVRIWDIASGKTTMQLRGHRSWVHAVAFSPDGKRLLSASKDTTARVWDLDSGVSVMALSGHVSEVWGAGFSADGTRAFTSSPDSTVKVWDVRDRVRYSEDVTAFFVKNKVPDFGRGSSQETWTYYGHVGPVLGVALSDDGRLAATGATVNAEELSVIRVWDLDQRREVRGLPVPSNRLNLPTISPDGKFVAVGSSGIVSAEVGELRLFELSTGKLLNRWTGPTCQAARPAFSPDGKQLACGFASGSNRSMLVVYDLTTKTEAFRQDRGSGLLGPAYLGDGRFVTAAADGMVRVQDGSSGREIRSWKAAQVLSALGVSPTGAIATGERRGADAIIRLWDTEGTGGHELKGHVGMVTSLAFGPGGKRLFSAASDFTLKLWHTGTGHELLTWREHRDIAHQIAWSADGRRLASVGQDGALKVWEGGGGSAAPKSDEWKEIYRDDFEREQLGERWQAQENTRWSIREGKLVGEVASITLNNTTFTYANIRLGGVELPQTVEVNFRVRVSQPMLVAPQLRDPIRNRSLVPFLAGRPEPFGFTGAGVMLIAGKEKQQFSMMGLPRERSLTPGQDHRFRIVRTSERLWLFIDGEEVLAEDVPPVNAHELGLQGSWSTPGAGIEIAFDDLEIRAPADAILRRRLQSLVEAKFSELGSRAAVREALASDTRLSPAERKLAEELLGALREDADRLVRQSLETSLKREASATERKVALLQAEAAARLALRGATRVESLPLQASNFLAALGFAKLRAGRPSDALADLKQSVEVRRRQNGAANPGQLAGLALAAHRAGQVAQAAEYRRQARLLLLDAPEDEAKQAKSSLDEMNEVVKAAADEAEVEAIFRAMHEADVAGWYRRDLESYLAGRTDEWKEVSGRTETAEKSDVTLDRSRAAKKRPWDFRQLPPGTSRIQYEEMTAKRDGDTVILRYTATVQLTGAGWFRTWRAEVRMKKVGDTWKNASGRSWPIRGLHRGRFATFDVAFWKKLDAEANAAEGEDKTRALLEALRPADALAVMKQLTAEEGASAELWSLRGRAAIESADVEEARASYRKAESLDPNCDLHAGVNGTLLDLTGHSGDVFGVAYLPGGELLSGGHDGKLRRWSATGKMLQEDKVAEPRILALATSADGKRLAVAAQTLHLIDRKAKEVKRAQVQQQQAVYRVAFDAEGKRVVAACSDGMAYVVDSETGRPLVVLRGHTRAVMGAVFSPDGKRVATASVDRSARLWDAETGKPIRTFGGEGSEVFRVAFSLDGKTLATAGRSGEVFLWDVESGKRLHAFDVGKEAMDVVAISPDGKLLAAAGDTGLVRIWRLSDRKLVRVLRGHTKNIFALAFSHDGKRLAASGQESTVRVWEVPEAE